MRYRFLLLIGLLTAALRLPAQTVYTPVAVRGYMEDIVANGTGAATTSTTIDMDGGPATLPYCYVAEDFENGRGERPTSGLPMSGRIASSAVTGLAFQLAPYDEPNSVRIAYNGTGSLELVTPQGATEVLIAAASGRGNSVMQTTVTFTDNTTQLFAVVNVPDWFDGNDPIVQGLSRVNRFNDDIESSAVNPRIYAFRFPLSPANYRKQVASVTCTMEAAGTSFTLNILAITLGSNCPFAPEPGTVTLSADSVCIGAEVTLTRQGAPLEQGQGLIWETSTDSGATWADLPGSQNRMDTVLVPLTSTWYRVRVNCGPQVAYSDTLRLYVEQPVSPRIAYAARSYCPAGFSDAPTVSPAGGRFRGSAGTVVDSLTGVVDLAASAPGQRTVTYTYRRLCVSTAQARFTVQVQDSAAISYGRPPLFCPTGTAAPVSLSPTGGRFEPEPGLVMDTATGVVDLAATGAGSFRVVYRSRGACPATDTAAVDILSVEPYEAVNLIVPNGLPGNRELRFGNPFLRDFELTVVNRWGRQVYHSTDHSAGYRATDDPAGVYFYQLRYTDCRGQQAVLKSWLEVVK